MGSGSAFVAPLSPLTAAEITATADLIQKEWPGTPLDYRTITLREPEKRLMITYLDALNSKNTMPPVPRVAYVSYYPAKSDKHYEAYVNLTLGRVVSNELLRADLHGTGFGDAQEAVDATMADAGVQAALKKLQLPEGTIILPELWIYGSDDVDDHRRMYQVYLYAHDPHNSSEEDSNHYAFPLPISPVVDTITSTVVRIDRINTGADNTPKDLEPYKVYPPNEYLPKYQKLRTDLEPLTVLQPEGASFTVQQGEAGGELIEWQKWSFQLGFNAREGIVLYNVTYDGRSLFYRLSLSDMNIPYADPRPPLHRKAAFDLGDIGAGISANNLKLGCDCLGSIHYFSTVLSDPAGKPQEFPNVVCVHEQDNGIGWKHTNFRTNKAAVVRNRELVIQTIMTAANYEYILAFIFNQSGEICYEVRATGILSTQPIDEDVKVPWGTVVHPGVLAPHHQHIFSLRIDAAIDGHNNQLSYTDTVRMPLSELNPFGTGFVTEETIVEHSAALNGDVSKNRSFRISNPNVLNPVNGKPVSYKIQAPPYQHMLAEEDSFHYKRAEFASHDIYVTKHRDEDLYSGGWYTNQSRGGTGVRSFVARNEKVRDENIVVWVSFGMTHVPRIEDFPVMPVEIIKVALKPANFFDKNPALDVPASTQEFNQSVSLDLVTKEETPVKSTCCVK